MTDSNDHELGRIDRLWRADDPMTAREIATRFGYSVKHVARLLRNATPVNGRCRPARYRKSDALRLVLGLAEHQTNLRPKEEMMGP